MSEKPKLENENIVEPKNIGRRDALKKIFMFGGGVVVSEAARQVSIEEIKGVASFLKDKFKEDRSDKVENLEESQESPEEEVEENEAVEETESEKLEREWAETCSILYGDSLNESERLNRKSSFEYKKNDFNPKYIEEREEPTMNGLNLMSKKSRFGLEGWSGRYAQVLRFQNMTMAAERKYNLPHNLILSMMVQETAGEEFLPNAIGDGGFGLVHMQPATASEFGLRTFKNCKGMVCNGEDHRSCLDQNGEKEDHAGDLAQEIKRHPDDREYLGKIDHRLNHMANIDTVGRMLAHYMDYYPKSKAAFKGDFAKLGPLRTAICRYSGTKNFNEYWNNISKHMALLSDGKFVEELKDKFDRSNIGATINGEKLTLSSYVENWQKFMMNYNVYDYVKSENYNPKNSQKIMKNYKDYLPVVGENTRKRFLS